MRLIITGGAGFIGSHTVLAALERGHDVVVVDSLINSHPSALAAVEDLAGRSIPLHRIDLRDGEAITAIVRDVDPEAVVHFAGLKHVGESTQFAREYYDANLGGLLGLLAAADSTTLRHLVFSSSGSVYGETTRLPITESQPHRPTNPYSMTKSMGERILADLCRSDPSWTVIALRYFNPAGAHPSGRLGECCVGPPSNLLPRLIDAAHGDGRVRIHGDDFDTADGTGVRDYIHVVDVAEAHLRALEMAVDPVDGGSGFEALNIGRGVGVSVRELIAAVEQASGRTLDVSVGPRRPGDVSALYGDTKRAAQRLGLRTYRSLEEMCSDAWRFKMANPDGYQRSAPTEPSGY